jgi:AcrR family transcriptional regulator
MRRSSVETKAVILAAARERFAESGFEKATIRAIAADANIDPSMVMRYFGNKDQLFAAAADFDLAIPDLSDVDTGQLGARLVEHFVNRWERDEALIVLLRSGATNTEAADRMRQIFATQLLPVIAKVNPVEPQRRAGLIATQVLGLALCRYVLRLPPVVGLSHDEIVSWLGPTVQRYLEAPE